MISRSRVTFVAFWLALNIPTEQPTTLNILVGTTFEFSMFVSRKVFTFAAAVHTPAATVDSNVAVCPREDEKNPSALVPAAG